MKFKTKLPLKDALISTILSCIVLGILSIAFFNIRFFNPLEKAFKDFSFLDVYFSQKFDETSKVIDDIVIINVENHDRTVITYLLEKALNSNPKVIGFDIILKEQEKHSKSDSILASLLENKKIVKAFEVIEDNAIYGDPFFKAQNNCGYVNFNFDDEEEVIREFVGIKKINTETEYSFATRIAKTYLGAEVWGKRNYDQNLNTLRFIKYVGNSDKFPVLTLDDFIEIEDKDFLKNKIVLFGYLGNSNTDNSNDITDKFWTPLNEVVAGKSDRDMYGVIIHANIINMLLKNDMVKRVSSFWLILITIIIMYISTILYMKFQATYANTYGVRIQAYQLIFSICLLILSFWLLSKDILFSPLLLFLGLVVSGSYFEYYDEVLRYLKRLRIFKSKQHE